MNKKLGPLPVWGWAAIGGGLLLLLYLRGRSSGTSQTSQLSQVDPNNPLGLTYQQEQADLAAGIDPNSGTTFAAESAAAGGGAGNTLGTTDLAPAGTTSTVDLTGLQTQLQGISDQVSTLQGGNTIPDPAATQTGAQTFATEIGDVTSGITSLRALQALLAPTPATAQRAKQPALKGAGAIRAPFGSTKPTAPAGYRSVGLGSGYWEFTPVRRTVTHTAKKSTKPAKQTTAGKVHITKGK